LEVQILNVAYAERWDWSFRKSGLYFMKVPKKEKLEKIKSTKNRSPSL
jgi:hypothetical protein